MGPTTWSIVIKVIEVAVDEAMSYAKEKLKNGGKHDRSRNQKKK
jgi:hypothetical protein